MMNLEPFPFRIAECIRISGTMLTTKYDRRIGVWSEAESHGLSEIVIDDQGKAWIASSGWLRPMTAFGAPNYQDPRTEFNAICNSDKPDEVTGFIWVSTKTGDVVEEWDDNTSELLARIPPDRRHEWQWATLLTPA